ncbi:MAG: lactoylglutathione lyase [Bacteroidetes bacterium]|nr:lactoylglutathione lyase [Bacteroidota bacterium]
MNRPKFEIILYVANQQRSRDFYASILQIEPSLDVPGMSEFKLSNDLLLGLMPENGIAKILSNKTPHPNSGNGIPRCELYFRVENIEEAFVIAINKGAKLVSQIQPRDWGDTVGYLADFDGHIIAYAKASE